MKLICKIKKIKGFTLIEVLVAIGIMAILAGIGIPAFNLYQPTIQLSGSTREIISNLRYAEQLAVAEQVEYGIRFATSTNQYQLVRFSSQEQILITKTLPDKVSFQQVSGFTNDEVKYNPYGAVREEGSIVLVNTRNETKTILVRPSGFVKTSN